MFNLPYYIAGISRLFLILSPSSFYPLYGFPTIGRCSSASEVPSTSSFLLEPFSLGFFPCLDSEPFSALFVRPKDEGIAVAKSLPVEKNTRLSELFLLVVAKFLKGASYLSSCRLIFAKLIVGADLSRIIISVSSAAMAICRALEPWEF